MILLLGIYHCVLGRSVILVGVVVLVVELSMGKEQRQAKIAELLALVELEEAADRVISNYSGGMKRRLELIRGQSREAGTCCCIGL